MNILCMLFGHQLSIGRKSVHNDYRIAIECARCGFYNLHGDQIHSPQEEFAMNTGQMARGYRSLPKKEVAMLLVNYVLKNQDSLPDEERMSLEDGNALLALAESDPEKAISLLT